MDALSTPIMLRALTPRYRQWVLTCDHAFAFVWRATLLSTPNWSIRLFGRRIFTAVLNRQRGAYDAISARCADLSSSLSAAARLRILFTACQQSAIGIEWYSPCKVYAMKAPGIGTRVAKRGPAASKSSSSPSDASSYVCSVFVLLIAQLALSCACGVVTLRFTSSSMLSVGFHASMDIQPIRCSLCLC